MGRYEQCVWPVDGRLEPYRAYVPDTISDWTVALEPETAGALTAAEVALRMFEQGRNDPVLARVMLLAEAVASSLIEGLGVSAVDLFRGLMEEAETGRAQHPTTRWVLDNVKAMEALAESPPAGDVTLEAICAVNRTVMVHSRIPEHGGLLREVQNWVGRQGDNPTTASFVPPPPELVPELMEDLVAFCNGDELPPVAQAALAHVQFETIHPFADGNGRTGRALSHLVLRRRGVGTELMAPISAALYDWHRDYVGGLIVSRYDRESRRDMCPDRSGAAANQWLRMFADACVHAVEGGKRYVEWSDDIRRRHGEQLHGLRSDAGARLLLAQLPAHPVVNSARAAALTGKTRQTAIAFLRTLEKSGVLVKEGDVRRNRVFEAPEYCRIFDALLICRTAERDFGDTFVV